MLSRALPVQVDALMNGIMAGASGGGADTRLKGSTRGVGDGSGSGGGGQGRGDEEGGVVVLSLGDDPPSTRYLLCV